MQALSICGVPIVLGKGATVVAKETPVLVLTHTKPLSASLLYLIRIESTHTRIHIHTQACPAHRVTEEDRHRPAHFMVAPSQCGGTEEEAEKSEEGTKPQGGSEANMP